jgi:hypothetical protein
MNSLLLHVEHGRLTPDSYYPRDTPAIARFVVSVPDIIVATVFLIARKNDADAAPFQLMVNGGACTCDTDVIGEPQWLSSAGVDSHVKNGVNDITVLPQPGWDLFMEATSMCPIVRLRVVIDTTLGRQRMPSYGDPGIDKDPEVFLSLLPESLNRKIERGKVWDWCWDLAGFLAQAWPYANTNQGSVYGPWDGRTLLEWGNPAIREKLPEPPITMCVHYAMAFVQFAIAKRIPARAVVTTGNLNSTDGHFVVEVWIEAFRGWAMIDPTLHLAFRDSSGRPLGAAELWGQREKLAEMAEIGDGFPAADEVRKEFYESSCRTGTAFRLTGVWGRHDFIDRPELAPPAHGSTLYAETDIIWCATAETTDELGMFPEQRLAQQLNRPPSVRPSFG